VRLANWGISQWMVCGSLFLMGAQVACSPLANQPRPTRQNRSQSRTAPTFIMAGAGAEGSDLNGELIRDESGEVRLRFRDAEGHLVRPAFEVAAQVRGPRTHCDGCFPNATPLDAVDTDPLDPYYVVSLGDAPETGPWRIRVRLMDSSGNSIHVVTSQISI
jgi:hypothetical protein